METVQRLGGWELTKRCKACGRDKPLREYYSEINGRLGRFARCIPCYLEAQREPRRLAERTRRKRDGDRMRAVDRAHYARNREKICSQQRKYARLKGVKPRPAAEERFWRRVRRGAEHECWLWTGTRNNSGYGIMYENKKFYVASRFVWELLRGPIPNGLLVCHHCDTPLCVNPNHLFLGTVADNNSDKERKGRARTVRGSKHGCAKLTEFRVIRIREEFKAGATMETLAQRFGVRCSTIESVVRRRTWRHVA